MLSPSPFSLQISALLLGARQQSKEDIVLSHPIPGITAQQQHGNLGREPWCQGHLSSCMGHAARGCPAAAGRGSKSPSHLLGLSGSTNHSPKCCKLEQYQDFSPSTSPSVNWYGLCLVGNCNDPGTGWMLNSFKEASESRLLPEIKPKPLRSQYSCDLSAPKENYMSIGIYLSVGSLSFVLDIWFYMKSRCHLEQCQKSD